TPQEDQPGAAPVAILGYSLWQRRFAASDSAIGAKLLFDGNAYTVVGVAAPRFKLDGWAAEVFTPLGRNTEPNMRNRDASLLNVMARLRPGTSRIEGRNELSRISQSLADQFPKSNRGLTIWANPFHRDVVGAIGGTLWLLLAAVGVVLLIACV